MGAEVLEQPQIISVLLVHQVLTNCVPALDLVHVNFTTVALTTKPGDVLLEESIERSLLVPESFPIVNVGEPLLSELDEGLVLVGESAHFLGSQQIHSFQRLSVDHGLALEVLQYLGPVDAYLGLPPGLKDLKLPHY